MVSLKDLVNRELVQSFEEVDEEQLLLLVRFFEFIKEFCPSAVASWPSDEKGIALHLGDALQCFYPMKEGTFLDVGSGVGVPGIIFSILWGGQVEGCLMDSRAGRSELLMKALSFLGLDGRLSVLCGRAEVLGKDQALREGFDFVTARALAPFPVFLEWCAPFVKEGGLLHLIRGEKALDEMAAFSNFAAWLGFSVEPVHSKAYQSNAKKRFSIVLRKEASTPSSVPRNSSQIKRGLPKDFLQQAPEK